MAAGAAAAIIAHIYPKEAQRVMAAAEEASRSRVLAGVAFPSDVQAGLDLGREVAERVIAYAKISDTKWSGSMPSGPGYWKGENPGGVNDVEWKTFALTSPSQFRPGPPPAPDSPKRLAELEEVKTLKRTPVMIAKANYWQYGQQGQPGLIFRLGEEVGLRLAEAGVENNARRAARAYALSMWLIMTAGSRRRMRSSITGRRAPISSTRRSQQSFQPPTSRPTLRMPPRWEWDPWWS